MTPDITTLAKIVTGGLPGGAVAGKAEIMDLLSPSEARDGLSPACQPQRHVQRGADGGRRRYTRDGDPVDR